MKGSTNERRTIKVFEASKYAGTDFSIPDNEDHAKHLAAVRLASPRGFPWVQRRPE